MLYATQIGEEGERTMAVVNVQSPHDIPIDPTLMQDDSRKMALDDDPSTSSTVGEGEVPILDRRFFDKFDPNLWGYGYDGQDQQAKTTAPNASLLYLPQMPYSHTSQWPITESGQPQPSLSVGDRKFPADSLTAQSEHGDNELLHPRMYSRGLNTGLSIGIDLNTANQDMHINSLAQQQVGSQPLDSPVDYHNNRGFIPGATLPGYIAPPNLLPPSDPHCGDVAQIQTAFTGSSDNNGTSQSILKFDKVLTINGPRASALREAVMNDERRVAIIDYILASAWYQEGRKEELPDGNLQKCIPKRRGADAKDSPFGAFVSQKSPYTCLFCNDRKGRGLCRAIGHARSHFGYKIDGKHTNWNAKSDQERRANSPTHECKYCRIPVTKQNWARHGRSASHKQKESLSNATASTSAQ